ncbi:MAG: hypothetical protein ACPGXL_07785 [Chitinophagales bacterium]
MNSNSALIETLTTKSRDVNKLPGILYENRWPTRASGEIVDKSLKLLQETSVSAMYESPKMGISLFMRLLMSFGKVKMNEEQMGILKQLTAEMVEVMDVKKENISNLSQLGHNLSHLNPEAYKKFINRLITEIDLKQYIDLPYEKGFLPLVKQLKKLKKQGDFDGLETLPKVLPELIDGIFNIPFEVIFRNSHTSTLNLILWELLQIDRPKLISALRYIRVHKWTRKVGMERNKDTIFRLLWILHHIDDGLTYAVANFVWNRNLRRGRMKVTPEDVPLLGFMINQYRFQMKGFVPNEYDLARYISNNYTLSHIAYTAYYIKRFYAKSLGKFRSILSRVSFYRNPHYSFEDLLDNYPIIDSKYELSRVLGRFRLLDEPDSTFKKIESGIFNNRLELNNRTKDQAIGAFYSEYHPRALFKDKKIAGIFVRLFYEREGLEFTDEQTTPAGIIIPPGVDVDISTSASVDDIDNGVGTSSTDNAVSANDLESTDTTTTIETNDEGNTGEE